jgi:hypothetical protein
VRQDVLSDLGYPLKDLTDVERTGKRGKQVVECSKTTEILDGTGVQFVARTHGDATSSVARSPLPCQRMTDSSRPSV